jgi:hypothetical protein
MADANRSLSSVPGRLEQCEVFVPVERAAQDINDAALSFRTLY